MCSNRLTNLYLAGGVLICVTFVCVLAVSFAGESQTGKPADEKPNENTRCYVCHPDLKTEEISTVHLDADITCDECHGPSVEHLEDEMLMTKPDLLFGRSEVDKMCSNPTCHKPGGDRYIYAFQDHIDTTAVKDFYNKWLGRIRPNGRVITAKSVCTDCHGTHNIVTQIATQLEKQTAEWIAAFNGRDLTGWQAKGNASWTVEGSRLIAKPGTNGAGGDLWTEALYKDYRLSVTFRAEWLIRAGIWLRAADPDPGPRGEIFDSYKPPAFAGSVWAPRKGLVLANLREDLVDRQGWNTISVEVRGDRFGVWLNGEEIGAFRSGETTPGQIGLHIESHPKHKEAALTISEMLVQRLDEPAQAAVAASPKGGPGFVPIFNNRDLTGWKANGGAKWTVKDGTIIGTQGENNAKGDLLTELTYKDFLLTVTYRVQWPCNSGIWFRYQSAAKAYQADILEYKKPECYSGTLYCTGKMFISMNTDKTLVDREGWNTMSVRAEGDHIQIWLNGRQVADVRDDASDSGRIGFQVHAGNQLAPMKVIVRDVLLKPL